MGIDISLDAEELSKSSLFIGMPCYGGQMSGITARSLSHLSSLCDYYGIKLHHHYLFQESLITRARAYVADEFMRSDYTHLMFIDSDIGFNAPDVLALMALANDKSDYDIICGPYPKKSLTGNTLVDTENGTKTLKWIVDNKYTGKVLTINEKTNQLEWNRVLTHSVDPGHFSKQWVQIKLQGTDNKIICTDDHELIVAPDRNSSDLQRFTANDNRIIGKYLIGRLHHKHKIVGIKHISQPKHKPRKQYDIGVENNHNFVANGFFVSNCIAWEKIKTAVDKGFADDDPSQLERFVGDYVFNPKGGKFKLNEPVEVLEAGTGFMMIRRKTFEAFDEAYPYLKYKPDHARSKHFDGSREIMMYFDCEIDRGYSYQELHNLKNNLAEAKTDEDLKKLRKEAKRLVKLEEQASKRYLSEDYFFSRLAQRIGLKVWMCPWIQLKHMGSYIYGGSVPDLAMIGASVTVNKDELKKQKELK